MLPEPARLSSLGPSSFCNWGLVEDSVWNRPSKLVRVSPTDPAGPGIDRNSEDRRGRPPTGVTCEKKKEWVGAGNLNRASAYSTAKLR